MSDTDNPMDQKIPDACGNCRFYEPDYEVCRRYPKVYVGDDHAGREVFGYPPVQSNDWCGEWKP